MKTKRQKQMEELIRRSMSSVLQAEGGYIYGHDKMVTVTSVDITPDFSLARIYVSVFNAEDKNEVIALLTHSSPLIWRKLSQRIGKQIRKLPKIEFLLDGIVDEMHRVNDLLKGLDGGEKSE